MYIPPEFREVRQSEIQRITEQFPLATIICQKDGEIIANHIPLLWAEAQVMEGHIALANPLHRLFPDGSDALAIFSAQDSYISPQWYPSKQTMPKHVPTWNYQVVHMQGRLRFDYSAKAKLGVVGKLTKTHEAMHSGARQWKMSDAPRDYMDEMLDKIVAFQFTITNIIAKSKISQNRVSEDYRSVATKMKENQLNFIAQSMTDRNK